eukprot:2954158-Alexandrium_andersonii.AAC.1
MPRVRREDDPEAEPPQPRRLLGLPAVADVHGDPEAVGHRRGGAGLRRRGAAGALLISTEPRG